MKPMVYECWCFFYINLVKLKILLVSKKYWNGGGGSCFEKIKNQLFALLIKLVLGTSYQDT